MNFSKIVAATRLTGGSRFGYKPLLLGQRLKALAFTSFKPLCFSLVARPFKGQPEYRLTPKGVLVLFHTQFIHHDIRLFLLLNILFDGVLIEPDRTHVISFCPEMPIPKLIF